MKTQLSQKNSRVAFAVALSIALLALPGALNATERLVEPSVLSIDEASDANAILRAFEQGNQTVAIGLPLQFKTGSAQLDASGRKTLEALVSALTTLLSNDDFSEGEIVIEGHTDSVGDAEHNLILSERRANEVKRLLETFPSMADRTMSAVGFGETRPIKPFEAESAENRRVNIRVELPQRALDRADDGFKW